MSKDKIYPLWINDRLPTEGDGDKEGCVIIMLNNMPYAEYVKLVEDAGGTWCKVPDDIDLCGKWQDRIATPDECKDREDKKTRTVLQELAIKNMLDFEKENKELDAEVARLKEENKNMTDQYAELCKENFEHKYQLGQLKTVVSYLEVRLEKILAKGGE